VVLPLTKSQKSFDTEVGVEIDDVSDVLSIGTPFTSVFVFVPTGSIIPPFSYRQESKSIDIRNIAMLFLIWIAIFFIEK
jgi:hypothetical protein